LAPGKYYLRVALFDQQFNMDDRIEESIDFEITINSSKFISMNDSRPGVARFPFVWKASNKDNDL
jgi:hypothetical protein